MDHECRKHGFMKLPYGYGKMGYVSVWSSVWVKKVDYLGINVARCL